MKIALFIDTFNLGGAETMVIELASILAKNQNEVILLHFGNDYIHQFAKDNRIESRVLPNHRLYKKSYLIPLFILKTVPFIKSLNLDCIHSHLYPPITAMAIISYFAKAKHIGTLHDIYTIEESPNRVLMLKIALFLKTKLIVISNQMHRFYTEKHHLSNKGLHLIPNFAPNQSANSRSSGDSLAKQMQKDEISIISVGRLVELKRFDILIEACELLAREETKFHLFIVGDGPLYQDLLKLIHQKSLGNYITLLGERRDVMELLVEADIFTLCSETEGLSRSILESLSAGTPIVATNVGGNSDLVEDGTNGFLVPVNDTLALSKRFKTLINNSDLRHTMSENCIKKAQSEFSAEKFLQEHIQLYNT